MKMIVPQALLCATGALFGVAGLWAQGTPSEEELRELEHLKVPAVDVGIRQLPQRRDAQLAAAQDWKVFTGFSFSDQQAASGLDQPHTITEDGGRRMKMVHYDHGNGLLLADVDGDGLSDMLQLNQVGPNVFYENKGGGKFEQKAVGVELPDRVSVAGAFADVDNDGDPDLFVTSVRGGNVLFENDGKGRFRDVTAESGLEESAHSSGAVFFDYDRDGVLDLFVTNVGSYTVDERGPGGYYIGREDAFSGHLFPERAETSRLYRGLGKSAEGRIRFEDVTEATGLLDDSWSGDAAPVDFTGDGLVDLYVLNMQGDDHFWVNQGGERFVEQRAKWFPKTPWGAMGVAVLDQNGDGLLDLLLTDMHSDMSLEVDPPGEYEKAIMMWDDNHLQGGDDNIFGNAFYRNTGEAPFEELSDEINAENYWPWGASVGDLNADGWSDVFIASSMAYPYRYAVNSVLLNDEGEVFRHAEFVLGIEPRADGNFHLPYFVVDCGDEVDRAWPRHGRICGPRRGRYVVEGTKGTRTAAIFDIEGDGDLDIVTGEWNSLPQVLVSDLSERRRTTWLAIELRGTTSNRDGLGALVRVYAKGRVQTQLHDGRSGYLSQSSQPLWFGLGGAQPEKVEVVWPNGKTQVVSEGLASGKLLEVEEAQ